METSVCAFAHIANGRVVESHKIAILSLCAD